jgi:hypothetical protein
MPMTRNGAALLGQDRAGLAAFTTAIPNTTTRPGDVVRVATEKACSQVANSLLDLAAYGFGFGCLLVLLGAPVAGWVVALTFAALLHVPSAVAR